MLVNMLTVPLGDQDWVSSTGNGIQKTLSHLSAVKEKKKKHIQNCLCVPEFAISLSLSLFFLEGSFILVPPPPPFLCNTVQF